MKTNNNIPNITKEDTKKYAYTVVGTIKSIVNKALAEVIFEIEEKMYSHEAQTTEALNSYHENAQCTIVFNQGDITKPIITGIIQEDNATPLVLSCEDGILLESGSVQITLEPTGVLNLQAPLINSQAYGPYRIKGASVKIN